MFLVEVVWVDVQLSSSWWKQSGLMHIKVLVAQRQKLDCQLKLNVYRLQLCDKGAMAYYLP